MKTERLATGLVLAAGALWWLIDTVAFADPPKSLGCDVTLTQAGYVDEDGRLEFLIPFDSEPACDCGPKPCEERLHISKTDAVLSDRFRKPLEKGQHPPRIVCWGQR